VWSSVLDGRRLTFRLAGINNQNFVMRDEQTGTWWQQVSGLAIQGPLKGKRLTLIPHDELMFATWKAEEPSGRVLKTDPKIVKEEEYEPADWEDHVGKYPVKVAKAPGGPLEPRTLVVGIAIKGKSKAWPHASVLSSGATIDQVGDVPVALVVSPDGRSLRAFDRRVKDQTLTFVRAGTDLKESTLLDLETMSEWDFQGRAVKGELAGSQLTPVDYLLDYWFDWKTYHPDTEVLKPWTPVVKKKTKSAIPPPKGPGEKQDEKKDDKKDEGRKTKDEKKPAK
jgi:Protein of unknown function (DUF3179)